MAGPALAPTPGPISVEAKGQLAEWFPFPGTPRRLCVWRHEKQVGKERQIWSSVELHDVGTKKVQVVKRRLDGPQILLIPSPDRSRVALQYRTAKQDYILVLDSAGQVLADFVAHQK